MDLLWQDEQLAAIDYTRYDLLLHRRHQAHLGHPQSTPHSSPSMADLEFAISQNQNKPNHGRLDDETAPCTGHWIFTTRNYASTLLWNQNGWIPNGKVHWALDMVWKHNNHLSNRNHIQLDNNTSIQRVLISSELQWNHKSVPTASRDSCSEGQTTASSLVSQVNKHNTVYVQPNGRRHTNSDTHSTASRSSSLPNTTSRPIITTFGTVAIHYHHFRS